ncbi:MAG TPA: acetolactate synthase small subunit, partial [Methanocorpusculum sp.]|nr:acetolactate synthase small subunit [Methanocorpusculum sp.]
YNIDSLTVSATNDPHISRITIVVSGDEAVISQIISQTRKLVETRDIFALNENRSLLRELLLVKLAANESKRSAIREVADIYGADIVDLSVDSMIVELTGAPTKIDAFLEVIKEYDILEMCRTGITALERGIRK